MKAIQVSSHGGPAALEYVDAPDPRRRPDRMVVSVEAAGVNFIDTYHRRGLYPVTLPLIPGVEGAGTVTEVGADISAFAPGDRVAWVMVPGSYADQIALAPHQAYRIPDDVTAHQAAAVLLQGLTAHALAHTVYPISPGDAVLIHAAAGGVGQLLTQLAKARGARVIATVGSAEKAAIARSLGASEVIRYDQFDDMTRELPETVRAITLGEGVHAVYDGVGAATFDGSLASLRTRGFLVLFGQASGPVAPVDPQDLSAAGSVYLTRPSLGAFLATSTERETRSQALFDMVRGGSLVVAEHARYPLSEAARAHDELESRATTGKVLLLP